MKHLPVLLLSLFAAPIVSHAQISMGVQAGIHTNKVLIRGIADEWKPKHQSLTTFQGGVYLDIPLQNGFSFQPGLMYMEKGFRVSLSTDDFQLGDIPVAAGVEAIPRLQYLEAPLLVTYTYGEGIIQPYVFAGPQFGYAVDGYMDFKARAILTFDLGREDLDLKDDIYNRWGVSGVAGLGLRLQTGPAMVFFQGSYQQGFTDMLNTPIVDIRLYPYGFNLTSGIRFTF